MGGERLTEAQGRQRLLDAAVELCLEVGGPEYTVRQVAAKAGVNHGLVHRYFGTKESLSSAVISQICRDLIGSPEPISVIDDPRGQVMVRLLVHSSSTRHLDDEMLRNLRSVVSRLSEDPSGSVEFGGTDPNVRAAVQLSAILGWINNEELITRSCGLAAHQRPEVVSVIEASELSEVGKHL